MKRLSTLTVVLAFSSVFTVEAQEEPQTTILDQPTSPIEVVSYDAAYEEGGRYSREGIHHEIEYRNTTSRPVRAVKFGLLSFSVFNDFIDRMGGIDMDQLDPGEESNGTWVATTYSDFSFFTGVTYVEQVRFLDGEIWEADLNEVAAKVREIQADFEADRLKGEPDRDGSQ